MQFYVGQKVVCIKDYETPRCFSWVNFPRKETVYTVRALCPNNYKPAILLEEIRNERTVRFEVTRVRGEPSFRSHNFRPLVEQKTDISIFTAMLDPSVPKSPALVE